MAKFTQNNIIKNNYNKNFSNQNLTKFKNNYLHFTLENFTVNNFIDEIIKNCSFNTTFSLMIKISCDNNQVLKMCGQQIGLVIKNEHDINHYKLVYDVIYIRIDSTINMYNDIESVDIIEILLTVIIPQPELTLKNISNINLNNKLINQNKVKKDFNENLLPLTTDCTYFGYPVLLKNRCDFINLIVKNNPLIFNKDKENLLIKEKDGFYIYEPPKSKKKFLILSQQNEKDKNLYYRYIFDFNSGIIIKNIKDYLNFSNSYYSSFNRTIGSVTLTIKNNKISMISLKNKLSPIVPINKKYLHIQRNTNFGTFDLETFVDSDGLAKVFAAGFITNIDINSNLFYLTDYLTENNELDSQKLLLNCIDSMLVNKYDKFIFYVHNLGRFDIIFMYNTLLKANEIKGTEYYKIKTVFRDDTIIKLDIKIKKKDFINKNSYLTQNYIKISFVDSLNLLNNSLSKLSIDFNVEHKKGFFPYTFVNKNNLNYIGNKPDISYYEKISDLEYNKINKFNWDLKQECLTYLDYDLKALLDVMNEFSLKLFINFNAHLTEALTITRLSLNIFLDKFYPNKVIPLINKLNIFNFIKEGFYGGITEVYKPHGYNLAYLDINSLYPYAALNPLPGLNCQFLESFEEEGLELNNLFGFFYAKVKTNNQYLGLLPLHINESLTSPNGEFSGIWSSEELKFARLHGYDITVIKGYNFNKIDSVFKDYIHNIFEIKNNSTGSLRTIAKSLLNNLIGRFGLDWVKPITETVNVKKRDFIASTRIIHSQKMLSENLFLLTYTPLISKTICEEHGLDYIKVLEKESKKNIENNLDIFKDVSIAIPAMVTSYARIFMNKIKLEILNNGGLIYYTDTDSIVIDKNSLIYLKNFIGNNIGQFKIEFLIKEAFFISNKTYCLILDDNQIIIKSKGVINTKLTIEDFKSMYYLKQNISAKKYNTKTFYEKGSVIISIKDVILNQDSFKKREKIFNNEGLWVDTKPLVYKSKDNIVN